MSFATAEHIAEVLALEGEQLLRARQLPKALERLQAAVRAGANPDRCDAGRWVIYMLLGEFESAWRVSDAIRDRGAPDAHRLWNGEDLSGRRIVVRCLHGFGDAVQFLRYAPQLHQMAANVIYEVHPRMLEVATLFDDVDQVVTWGEGCPEREPEWDVQIEVMQLPYIFRTQLHQLPITTSYMKAGCTRASRIAGKKLRVGVNCIAGEWNPERAIAAEFLDALNHIGGTELYDLRGGEKGRLESCLLPWTAWRTAPHAQYSIAGLTRAIAGMDLVITVDTLAAHLAGAMGIPCWIMLQHHADWRWMHERLDSPWYPSVRLFCQPSPGDWASVVKDICEALGNWREAPTLAVEEGL